MAKKTTTKKSTVGKTSKARTQKTRAASTTKKRTTKAAAAKKAPAKKTRSTAKRTTQKKKTTTKQAKNTSLLHKLQVKLHGLRGLHALSAIVFGALIACVYVFMEAIERTVSVSYAATDALRGEEVLAPAIRDVFTFDVRHGVAALLGIGLLYSVFVATRGWNSYLAKAEKGATANRWTLAVVLGVVGFALVAVLNGMYDLVLIKSLAILLVGAGYLGYQSDVTTAKKQKARFFIASVVAAVVAVAGLVAFIAFSMIYGAMLPLQAYLAADVLALALIAYAVNQLFRMKGKKGFVTAIDVERNYTLITTFALILFAATLVIGYMA